MYSQENLTGNHNSILLTIYISVLGPCLSRSKKVDLIYFIFIFIFIFPFDLFFYFLFLEQLGLGLIGHTVTSVTT